MWEIRHKHIEEYEKEHNCTHISKLNKYQNWRVLNIPIIKISKMYQYIDNKYLPQI